MFGTIRKHQKWLWAVIITLTIVSFVIYFGPQSRVNSNVRAANHGSIDGRKITDQDFLDAWREIHLHHFVTRGVWPEEDKRDRSNFEPERETYEWLLIVQKQRELGIHVGDEAAQQMARQIIQAFQRSGVSTAQAFFDRIAQKGYHIDDFERFVRHFVGLQELRDTIGLSGELIPPDQAKSLYERDHQEVATEAVFFWSTNYEARVPITPEMLGQFYSNMVATYRIPERVQVDYIRFDVTNFLTQAQSQITNLNELVDMNLQRMGTNLFPEAKSEDERKAKIREQLIRQQALYLARGKAMDFANVLFAMNPPKPENLKLLAASNNLPVEVTAPFDRDSTPKDLEVGQDFTKAAFALTADEPYSPPLIGQDGVYLIAMDKTIPSETPPLDQIRDRVTSDYKHEQSMRMARQDAVGLVSTITNGFAQGKSFTNICAEANAKPVPLPPFSITTPSVKGVEDIVSLGQLKQIAIETPSGKVAPALPTREGAMVLYVIGKLPLDPAREKTELPNYLAQLRRTRLQEAFGEWLRRQAETGLRDTPAGQPKPPPTMGTKTASAS